MKIPETREELFDEFSRYGYRGVIERCGLLNLLQHHTIDAIVWTAWHADEVAERLAEIPHDRTVITYCT